MLILLFLIGSVSANDVNTTDNEVTASQSIDSIDESTDNLQNNNDMLSSSEVNESNEISDSNIEKYDEINDQCNYDSINDNEELISNSDKNELLSSANNEILTKNDNEDILGTGSREVTITSNTITVKITTVARENAMYDFVARFRVENSDYNLFIGQNNYIKGQTITLSRTVQNTFEPGTTLNMRFLDANGHAFDEIPDYTGTVPKATPSLSINTPPTVYYNGNSYAVSGTCSVNGLTITLKQDSTTLGTATSADGKWTVSGITSTKLGKPSSYTLTATTTATTSYNSASATKSITVNRGSPTITVTSASVDYGSGTYSVIGTAKVGSNNVDTGTITLKQGSTVLGTASVSGGSWTVSNIDSTLVNPSSSAYTITANYESNDYYNAASGNGYLTVNKFTPNINIDSASIFYNQTDNAVIAGRVYKFDGDFYDGSIDLYVNGELVGSDITVSSNGYWSYTLSSTTNLAPSSTAYSVGIVWKGNNYTGAASSTENKYTVNKGITLAIPSADNIDYGRTEYVYVYVNNAMGDGYLSGIDVTLTGTGITGILTNTTDSNGLVTFAVAGLERGKYDDWKVSVVGNDYYSGRDINVRTFYVQFPLNVIITNITPNNSIYPEELIITGFTDADQIPNGNVSLIIGDKTYTGFFDSNGNFSASLIGVKPGTYNNITAKYNPTVDEFYYRGVESTVSIPETRNDQKC